eukprot:10797247-Prorocentrum_lima.AAC.1
MQAARRTNAPFCYAPCGSFALVPLPTAELTHPRNHSPAHLPPRPCTHPHPARPWAPPSLQPR